MSRISRRTAPFILVPSLQQFCGGGAGASCSGSPWTVGMAKALASSVSGATDVHQFADRTFQQKRRGSYAAKVARIPVWRAPLTERPVDRRSPRILAPRAYPRGEA